jgi:hypothetical protein
MVFELVVSLLQKIPDYYFLNLDQKSRADNAYNWRNIEQVLHLEF